MFIDDKQNEKKNIAEFVCDVMSQPRLLLDITE